ncbi:DNA polymerase III subunit gamma/tau [Moraxella sp. FZFQ2102]|uniref:DNA polymerase III subunit gamma/tau n=1 Tax=Moraxella sp. FZFQ2102 TaxID=2953752 RepID=UPI00209C25E4|nr:DNA polymerase III subunit gamma/tau [Moraxella sp. FZFQ2102]USZ14822.1 DNA polymerase III subunit gamma/tau [Moraxella sp. FZFQ2102]
MTEQYQVLARKYRPKNFSELLGQTHVSSALANAIDTGRLHHAYLFTGTRGVGKTTIARILAKCLNCETGITSTPCGVCDTCQSIDAGRFLDLIEIDAASRTKVEDTRDLLENVPYAPVQGRYKVYLIDEVHMLSTHSFNALLKTLEEPPEHVKFLFATTDPQKLPITIISRCLQFVLRPMPQALLAEHLSKVLSAESIAFTEPAIWQLANAAKGSVRDALSLTDQAIAFGGGKISDETVGEMLGLVNSTDVYALIGAVCADDRAAVAEQIATMRAKMVDAAAVFDELIDSIHQMAMLQVLPQTPLDMNDVDAERLKALASQISGDVLQLYYEILIKSRDGIRLASTPMQALEMAILRLLAFRPLSHDEVVMPNKASTPSEISTPSHIDTLDSHTDTVPNHDDVNLQTAIETEVSETAPSETNTAAQVPPIDDSHAQPMYATMDGDDVENLPEDAQSHITEPSADNLHNVNEVASSDIEGGGSDIDLPESSDNDIAHTDTLQNTDITDAGTQAENLQTINSADSEEAINQLNAEPSLSVQRIVDDANPQDQSTDDSAPSDNHSIDDNLDNQSQAITQCDHNTPLPSVAMTRNQLAERLLPNAVELTGDWTAEKWDYWLYLVRDREIFNPDELALLSQSVMTGQIDGDSQLIVSVDSPQAEISFESAKRKFAEHFHEITLSDKMNVDESVSALIPIQRQADRQAQLSIDAQTQLLHSPVIDYLWQAGFISPDANVLMNSKLNLDE